MIRAAVGAFGGLDCALDAAGMTGAPAPLQGLELDEFQRVIALDLVGVFLCTKHEIPAMRDGGAIVNMASGASLVPTPGLAPYCASKHGVLGPALLGSGLLRDRALDARRRQCGRPIAFDSK